MSDKHHNPQYHPPSVDEDREAKPGLDSVSYKHLTLATT